MVRNMTSQARSGIGGWLCLSAALCVAVTVSSRTDPGELGAPVYWTWALTGLQVLALWVAGRGQAWGWMVGSAVQPGWIAYALLTDQLGFVIRLRDLDRRAALGLPAGQWSDRQSWCRSSGGASRFSIRASGRSQIRYALQRIAIEQHISIRWLRERAGTRARLY
jgi:hypothetical protein